MQILKESCLDLALLVRKQALQALTKCLRAHPEEELLLRLWLEGALPLVLDAENTVMEKAVEAVEELILGPLCLLAPGPDANLAWRLLAQAGALNVVRSEKPLGTKDIAHTNVNTKRHLLPLLYDKPASRYTMIATCRGIEKV